MTDRRTRSTRKTVAEFVESQGWPPACKCGCGEPVRCASGRPQWNLYCSKEHADQDKIRKVKLAKGSRSSRLSQCRFWGDKQTPACKCGCGEPVPFTNNGPQAFVNIAHQQWYMSGQLIEWTHERHAELCEREIPIEQFREAVRKIKEAKGWSLQEMSVKGGYSRYWLNNRYYCKTAKYIRRSTAENFLRRLGGVGAPASSDQARRADRAARLASRAEQELLYV